MSFTTAPCESEWACPHLNLIVHYKILVNITWKIVLLFKKQSSFIIRVDKILQYSMYLYFHDISSYFSTECEPVYK